MTIQRDQLKNPSILDEADEILFSVRVQGQPPNYADTYTVYLSAIIDGEYYEDGTSNATATEKEEKQQF